MKGPGMTNLFRNTKRIALLLATVATLAIPAAAQGVDPVSLATLPTTSWPTANGDYTGQRHSPLTQITPDNIESLGLAWAFEPGMAVSLKATPILVDGVIYLSAPDHLWAVDARSGRMIWQYSAPPNKAFHIGHRGVGVYKDWIYLTTPDAHLVSLDARTGAVRWDVIIGDYQKGYWSTMAPLVVHDHVLVGLSGDFDNLPGMIKSVDPETGKTQWTWYSTSPAGTPNMTTGGNTWITGTYDPQLNLLYWGTGNPTPVLNGNTRPGNDPWTCSIVALDPDTGKLVWGFQPSPHDTHDWDAVEVPVLVDGTFNGQPKKMLMQASRNGYFFVLDRTNGTSLLTVPFAATNWAKGLDDKGQPISNPAKEPARDGRLVSPDEGGATNYRSPSFDPKTGLFIVSAVDSYGIYFYKQEDGAYGWAGADYGVHESGFLEAIDYQTGKARWKHPLGEGAGSGVLTTDSGLTFTGDAARNFMALRTSDGATLWHSSVGRVENSPVTYVLDGRQYVLAAAGGVLFAYALPEKSH
jgi:alcohol dehydrogenase (cytochrome c)